MKSHLFIILSLLCAASWAGDVQVDTNGNLIVDTGMVQAANVLSGQTPVDVTSASPSGTLTTAAFGKWHQISGITSDYAITLPTAVGNQGKCIGFRVRDATLATKTYTITPYGSEKIDGNATQALVSNGNLVLMSDGAGWARIGGTSTGGASSGTTTAALTDWQDAGPVVITATTTNPTKGTMNVDKVRWRRVGDSAEIHYEFHQATAGSAGSGTYLLGLPSGLSVDVSKIQQTTTETDTPIVGTCMYNVGATQYVGCARWRSSGIICTAVPGGTDNTFTWGSTGGHLGNTGVRFMIRATIPIAGWTGSQVVQSGSRFLWSQRYAGSASRVAAAPSVLGQYRSQRIGVDVAPTSAPSAVDGFRLDAGSGIAAGRVNRYDVYVGPNKVIQVVWYRSPGRRDPFNTKYYSAGTISRGVMDGYDPVTGVLSLVCYTGDAADSVGYDPLTTTHYATGYFDILVADDPVAVAQAPTVHVEASSDAGQGLTTGTTTMQYEDEATDTHGAWSGSVFTAPMAGVYAVRAGLGWTTSGQQYSGISLLKNGSVYVYGPRGGFASGGVGWWLEVTSTIRLQIGDAISFRIYGDSLTRSADPASNRLSITRVGE